MKKLISFTLFATLLLIVVFAQKIRVQEVPEGNTKTVAVIGTKNSL
jgi:hypothetical protein